MRTLYEPKVSYRLRISEFHCSMLVRAKFKPFLQQRHFWLTLYIKARTYIHIHKRKRVPKEGGRLFTGYWSGGRSAWRTECGPRHPRRWWASRACRQRRATWCRRRRSCWARPGKTRSRRPRAPRGCRAGGCWTWWPENNWLRDTQFVWAQLAMESRTP